MAALTFLCFFLISFFLILIVACRLCVIYVREEKWFQCIGYDYTADMDCMDPYVRYPPKGY